jgi:hypothetical protein
MRAGNTLPSPSLAVKLLAEAFRDCSHDLGGAGPAGIRFPFASNRLRSRARGFGAGVSGCERRWRICGGRVLPVAIDGTAADEGLTCDFRRVEMRSFTVGAASLSIFFFWTKLVLC